MSAVLADVVRSGLVESRHHGSLSIVDSTGRELASAGDPDFVTFLRSAAKPMQAACVVESGAIDRYGITEEELAVIAGSHNGEDRHVQAVRSILAKISASESDLRCGVQSPLHRGTARKLDAAGQAPSPVHHNCSGKHAGMLAMAAMIGAPFDDYTSPEHPVQIKMLHAVAQYAGLEPGAIPIGVDGCSVPVHGLSVVNMARAYARFAEPSSLPAGLRNATLRVARAMRDYPFMVAGSGRIDTDIMEVARGRVLAKVGAEGVYCVAVPDRGLGIAIKIDDGSIRPLPAVVPYVLAQLGVLNADDLAELERRQPVLVRDVHKRVVGQVQPAFSLPANGRNAQNN